MVNKEQGYIGYEYKTITISKQMESLYTDAYQNFGWELEGTEIPINSAPGNVEMKFKRDRKLRNKMEVTRLQRQFEACANEIVTLERSKAIKASVVAYILGILGCAFMAGSVFAYIGGMTVLCVILAIPGFAGWVLPYFMYKSIYAKKSSEVAPLIDQKYDEIYDVCERANALIA